MMRFSSITIFLFFFFGILSCSEKKESDGGWDVVITGKVGFPKEGNITIKSWEDTTEGFQIVDFDRSNYTFKSTIQVKEPGYWRINFFDTQIVDVAVYKSNLEVNVDGDKPNGFFDVVGSPDVQIFREIQAIRQNFNESDALRKLGEEFQLAVKAKDEKRIAELYSQNDKILKEPNDSIAALLVKNSPSIGVIEFLSKNELDPDQYINVYDQVSNMLSTGDWANYSMSKEFISMVAKMKVVAIGVVAPEISLPDPSGNIVKLSSLRGKYVLLDFWAKWCGPCRAENPNVVRVYNKYKDKGFEVFGVSLDRSKSDWLQAIEEDKLTWTQVSDLKYFNSEAARTYNINYIPFSILLDPEGKIIDKNLRGYALEAKLQEIFKPI